MCISCHLQWTWQAVLPSSQNFLLELQKTGAGFPIRETWPITAWKWPDCVHNICFPHCLFPEGEYYYSIVHQCVVCSGPALWDWTRDYISLCAGVMSMSRLWALVWEKIRRLQCVFSLWPVMDLSGTRTGVESVGYVTPCRWQELGSTGSCCQPLPNETHWRWPTLVVYVIKMTQSQIWMNE